MMRYAATKNGVAHVPRDTLLDVPTPGQRINAVMLHDAVNTDGEAGQHDSVDQAVDFRKAETVQMGEWDRITKSTT